MSTRDIGRMTERFQCCFRAHSVKSFSLPECALMGGNFIALNDACCEACEGMQDVRDRYRQYVEDGGERMPLREFIRAYGGSNAFIERVLETKQAIGWQSSI